MKKDYFILKFLFIFLFYFLTDAFCYSHPHVFIDYHTVFVFKEGKFVGINVEWYFDEFFSISTVECFDMNMNGKLDSDELEDFKTTTYEGIRDFNFFLKLTIDRKTIHIKDVKNFKIKILKNNLIIYDFFIPCNIVAAEIPIEIQIYFEDDTYFVAASTSQKNIAIKDDNSVEIINGIIEDEYIQKIIFKKTSE